MRELMTGNPRNSLLRYLGLSPVVILLVLLAFLAGCGGDSSSASPTSGIAPTETPKGTGPTQSPTPTLEPRAEPTRSPTPTLEPGVPSLEGSWRTRFAGGAPVTVQLSQTQRRIHGQVISDARSTLAAIEGTISGEDTVTMEVFWELVGFQLGAIPLPAAAWPRAVAVRGDSSHPGTVRSDLALTYDSDNDELIGMYTAVTIVIDESTGGFDLIKTDVVSIVFSRAEKPTPRVEIIEAKMIGAKRLRISVKVGYSGENTQRDLAVTVEFRNNKETTSFGTLTVESSGISESQGTFSLEVDLDEVDLDEKKIPRFMNHVDLDVAAEAKETWPGSTESLTGTHSETFERAILLPVIVTHGIIGDFAATRGIGLGSVGPGLDITIDDLIATDGYKKDGPYPTAHILVYPSFHADGIRWIAENKLGPKIREVLSLTYADRLDIVAHSMGGLISRYYIESTPGLNKGDKVRKLVMVGTPNEGAAGAHTALEGNGLFTPKAQSVLTLIKLLRVKGATREKNIGLTTSVQLLPAYRYYLEKARKPVPAVRGYGWPTDTNPRMELQKGKSGRLEFNTLLKGLNEDGLDNRVDNYNIYQNNHDTETTIRREQGRLGFWSVIKVQGPGDATVPVRSALLTDFPTASGQLNKCHVSAEDVHAKMLLDSGIRVMIKEILKSPTGEPPDSCEEKTAVGIDFDIKQSFSSDQFETPVDDSQENVVALLLVENNDDDDFNLVEDNQDEIISGVNSFFTGLDEKDEDKKDMATLILHRLESNDLPLGKVFIKKQSGAGNVRIFKESDNSLVLTTDGQTSSTTEAQAQVLFDSLKTGSETYLVEGVDPGELVLIIEYAGGEVEAQDEILIKVVDPPFDAGIRRVDFTNNHEIRRDRFEMETQHIMATQHINGFDADSVEWKDDDCDGTVDKNWPVAYQRNSQVTLNIELCVEIKEAGVGPITATVRGVARGNGADLVFEKTGVTLVDGTNTITGLTSQGNLPDTVTYIEPLIIEWTVSTGTSSDPAGASTHNVYTTFGEPGGQPLFFTVVHFTTHGAIGATTEQEAVDGIWLQIAGQVSSQTPGFATPQIRRREFDPMTGIIDTDGRALQYYNEVIPSSTLADFFPFLGFNCKVGKLLIIGEGRCGIWAEFMITTLDNHGIKANEMGLAVAFDNVLDCPAFEPDLKISQCIMLVKEWSFAESGGTTGDADYPFNWDEVVDERGAAGQSVENPQPWFWDHVIVEITINEISMLYDPSYGIGPYKDLEEYENASMSGFCKPKGPVFKGPYICRENPAGTQLTRTDS